MGVEESGRSKKNGSEENYKATNSAYLDVAALLEFNQCGLLLYLPREASLRAQNRCGEAFLADDKINVALRKKLEGLESDLVEKQAIPAFPRDFFLTVSLSVFLHVVVSLHLQPTDGTRYYRLLTRSLSLPRVFEAVLARLSEKSGLSKTERTLLFLMPGCRSNREMADTLCISLPTLRFHLRNLYQKTGLKNRVGLLHRLFNGDPDPVPGSKLPTIPFKKPSPEIVIPWPIPPL